MATNKRKVLTSIEVRQPSFPADRFEVFRNAVLVELENRKKDHDAKWGIDRLIWLVSTELREKVWAQLQRVYLAQESWDDEKMAKAVSGMCKAYDAMEAWATANNVEQVADVRQIEWRQPDGVIFVVVPDEKAKKVYLQTWPGTADRIVWTISEIAIIVNKQAEGQINELKRQWPGSQLVSVGGPSGFDDMENNIDMVTPSKVPKLFDTKAFAKA
jgi:hypothetical protein